MFTTLAIGARQAGAAGHRRARGRSSGATSSCCPLPIFFCALVQYVVFKEGADVHIFWPHYFAPYFALAVGALAASVGELRLWIGAQRDRRRRIAARAVRAPRPGWRWRCSGCRSAFILKDGLSLLRLARETGGRFAEVNLDTDLDKEAVLRWFLAALPATVGVGLPQRHPRRLGAAVGAAAAAVGRQPADRRAASARARASTSWTRARCRPPTCGRRPRTTTFMRSVISGCSTERSARRRSTAMRSTSASHPSASAGGSDRRSRSVRFAPAPG